MLRQTMPRVIRSRLADRHALCDDVLTGDKSVCLTRATYQIMQSQ